MRNSTDSSTLQSWRRATIVMSSTDWTTQTTVRQHLPKSSKRALTTAPKHSLTKKNTNHTMKVLGIIPARYASSRFPGKPLAIIDGKPMVQHVYERVNKMGIINDAIVATDDERIAACVK